MCGGVPPQVSGTASPHMWALGGSPRKARHPLTWGPQDHRVGMEQGSNQWAPWGNEAQPCWPQMFGGGNNELLLKTIDHVTSDSKSLRVALGGQVCLRLQTQSSLRAGIHYMPTGAGHGSLFACSATLASCLWGLLPCVSMVLGPAHTPRWLRWGLTHEGVRAP